MAPRCRCLTRRIRGRSRSKSCSNGIGSLAGRAEPALDQAVMQMDILRCRSPEGHAAGAGDDPHRGAHHHGDDDHRGTRHVKATLEPPRSHRFRQHLSPIAPPRSRHRHCPTAVPSRRQANSPRAVPFRQHRPRRGRRARTDTKRFEKPRWIPYRCRRGGEVILGTPIIQCPTDLDRRLVWPLAGRGPSDTDRRSMTAQGSPKTSTGFRRHEGTAIPLERHTSHAHWTLSGSWRV
jgi:hypothetical protein